jgi:aryl-alcohol dehydrogenase-like predicted oxidoreductase
VPFLEGDVMKYRQLGSSDVVASEVGFGVWTVSTGWWGEVDEGKAVRLLRMAFDLGVTFFDTADTYGNGYGEEVVAKALSHRRQEIVIATKFGYDFYSHGHGRRGQRELPQNFDPRFVRFALEQSLKRLGTDWIDFYQLHNARMDAIERDDLFALLEDMVAQGKIRAYGVALGPAIGWKEEGLAAMTRRSIAGLQIIYNLLEQDPGRAFFPVAESRKVGLLVRVPHSSGLLEGRYTLETTFPPSDHRSHRPREWLVDGLKKLERLTFLTEGRDMTLGQAAIKFILAQPSVTSVLPNIYNEDQLREFAEAPDKPDLTLADLAKIDDLYSHNFYLEDEEPARAL